jgi:hypothetical protein
VLLLEGVALEPDIAEDVRAYGQVGGGHDPLRNHRCVRAKERASEHWRLAWFGLRVRVELTPGRFTNI